MSELSKKILAVVVENAGKSADEIINAVCRALPLENYATIRGYLYQFERKGYLSLLEGDNRIINIGVNSSAYVALREVDDVPVQTSSPQINIGAITNSSVAGFAFGIGNKGNYDLSVTNTFISSMRGGLQDVLALADKQPMNPFEREQLKKIVRQILEAVEKSEPPPQGLIERLDAFLQRHSWISAPIAAAALNALSKLFG